MLPASTFALVTVDLNPSGGQKVEAIKTLRKFPSFRDQVGLKPDSDPLEAALRRGPEGRRAARTSTTSATSSPGSASASASAAWRSTARRSRSAALQVSDADNARTGFPRLAKCLELSDYGWTLTDDYIVISDSTALAKQIVAAGKKSPLSENADFQKWTDEAGGAGIMNAYVGRKAVDVMSEELSSGSGDLGGLVDGPGGSDEEQLADILAGYKDFKGAGAVLRFADGGIELSAAGSGGKATRTTSTVADHVSAMPADTALLLAFAVPSGAFKALEDADPNGSGSEFLGSMLGLDFPKDLQTLLGKSISISLGGDAPDDLTSINEPSDVSVGALIHGDSAGIDAVIAKLEKALGGSLADLQVVKKSEDGKVVLASNEQYADQLLGTGKLSDDAGFKDAVPHADDAQVVGYVDFDGEWGKAVLKTIRDEGGADDKEVADNLAVLRALGISAWTDGDVSHGLVRLSLK